MGLLVGDNRVFDLVFTNITAKEVVPSKKIEKSSRSEYWVNPECTTSVSFPCDLGRAHDDLLAPPVNHDRAIRAWVWISGDKSNFALGHSVYTFKASREPNRSSERRSMIISGVVLCKTRPEYCCPGDTVNRFLLSIGLGMRVASR